MKKKLVIFDLIKQGMDAGVKTLDDRTEWTSENLQSFIRNAGKYIEKYGHDGDYYVANCPPGPAWVLLSVMDAYREYDFGYIYPTLEFRPDADQVHVLRMSRLQRGVEPGEDNLKVVYEIIEDGDDIYLNINSDDPEKPPRGGSHHNFDLDRTDDVKVPDLPSGKNIFINSRGMLCVSTKVAWELSRDAKSVHFANFSGMYVCAISNTPEFRPGDKRPCIPFGIEWTALGADKV